MLETTHIPAPSFFAFDPISSKTDTYVKLCLRTASPLEGRANLLHSLLGVADELIEIFDFFYQDTCANLDDEETRTKLIKELGDVLWFTALYAYWAEYDTYGDLPGCGECVLVSLYDEAQVMDYEHPLPVEAALVSAVRISGRAVSSVKKEYAYHKQIEESTARNIFVSALKVVSTLCSEFAIDVQTVLDRNIEKLSARYKQAVFTKDEAVNRDEAKE